MPRPTLDAAEVRAVFALAEKALATPDQYPMTLASLVAACNQKTARDPVTAYTERDVRDALERLGRRGLVGTVAGAGHRVAKFRHLLDRALDLSRRELAALLLLALRGPQTAGEIKTRAERLAPFETIEAAEEALWLLAERDEPLVGRLPRRAGQAADRSAHLLSGPLPDVPPESALRDGGGASDRDAPADARSAPSPLPDGDLRLADRVTALEAEVASLRGRLESLLAQLE